MSEPLHLDDWGGEGPVLHLAHANGFPPGSYRTLIRALKPHYRVLTLRTRALVPGSDPRSLRTWDDAADDLAHALRAAGLTGVLGVGHSMGGVATLLASAKHPDLFRAVVALDPVLFTGKRLWGVRLLKLLGLMHRVPPASLARRRREHWETREAAAASYRKKPLFHRFHPEAFDDYVAHGLTEAPQGGVRLTIPRAWEARVFETSPHHAWASVRRVRVPALVLRGSESTTFTADGMARVQRTLPGVVTGEVPGAGHLFPLEQPEETARRLHAFLGPSSAPRA